MATKIYVEPPPYMRPAKLFNFGMQSSCEILEIIATPPKCGCHMYVYGRKMTER